MKRALLYLIALGVITACAATSSRNTSSVLVIGFKDYVSKQGAEAVLDAIFKGSQAQYEQIFQDPRSLEVIREKYPRRSLRAPVSEQIKQPLIYKVSIELNEKAIDSLIANTDMWGEIEFIQKDYQVQKYE